MDPLEQRPFGRLGWPVSALGFGTGGKGHMWGPADPDAFSGAVVEAVERGINFFDTSDSYGEGLSEELLGRCLAGGRGDAVFVCTKFGITGMRDGRLVKDFAPQRIVPCLEASLRRLRREAVDVFLLHTPDDDFDWAGYPWEQLEQLKDSGKIRAYGVSTLSNLGAERLLDSHHVDAVEVIYNAFDRRPEERLFERTEAAGVAFIARTPLCAGFLSERHARRGQPFPEGDVRARFAEADVDWRRDAAERLSFLAPEPGGLAGAALRFCLAQPALTTMIPGMSTAAQVRASCDALLHGPLDGATMERIRAAVPEVYAGWLPPTR